MRPYGRHSGIRAVSVEVSSVSPVSAPLIDWIDAGRAAVQALVVMVAILFLTVVHDVVRSKLGLSEAASRAFLVVYVLVVCVACGWAWNAGYLDKVGQYVNKLLG